LLANPPISLTMDVFLARGKKQCDPTHFLFLGTSAAPIDSIDLFRVVSIREGQRNVPTLQNAGK